MNDSSAPGHLTKKRSELRQLLFHTCTEQIAEDSDLYLSSCLYFNGRAYVYASQREMAQARSPATLVRILITPRTPTSIFITTGMNSTTRTASSSTQLRSISLGFRSSWTYGEQVETFHKQVGITESIAQIDKEFASEVPAQFQPQAMSDLRILAPAHASMASGAANGTYFDKLYCDRVGHL